MSKVYFNHVYFKTQTKKETVTICKHKAFKLIYQNLKSLENDNYVTKCRQFTNRCYFRNMFKPIEREDTGFIKKFIAQITSVREIHT